MSSGKRKATAADLRRQMGAVAGSKSSDVQVSESVSEEVRKPAPVPEVRALPVRVSVDLAPLEYAQLQEVKARLSRRLGRAVGGDIFRALLAIAADEPDGATEPAGPVMSELIRRVPEIRRGR